MRAAYKPPDELARLTALIDLCILDTPPEPGFDALAQCAAAATGAPIALVSLVDEARQWFKARVGLTAAETPREYAFCAHAILTPEPLVVPDSEADPRFCDNPLVTGAPHVKSYLGAPILSPDGFRLGTVCAIDNQARDWSDRDIAQVRALAALAQELLKSRAAALRAEALSRQVEHLRADLTRKGALLDEVSEIASVGAWEVNLATREVTWDRQSRRIHEVGDDYDPTLPKCASFYSPEHAARMRTAFESAAAEGRPFDLRLPLTTAKGRKLWVRAVGKPVFEGGKPTRFIGALQDVTAERAQELELTEALSRADRALSDVSAYQAALDKHAIVAITNARGDILFVNDRFCEISGFAREELLGRNHRILNSGRHPRRFFVDMWRAIGRGQSWHGEICNRSKDGREYWVDTTIVPMLGTDGRPERFVSVRYDITARKEADAQLIAAMEQLGGFFDVSLDLLCVADYEGRFVKVNKAFETTLGYAVDALEGNPFLPLVHPDDVEKTIAELDRLKEDGTVCDFVNRYRCADGTYRHIEWRSSPAKGFIYAAARDITERLRYEAELKNARDKAEAATAAKSAFLANMSHEIRTPLNGVIGIAGALDRTALDARQKEMVGLIRSSGETLERLLSDILDMSKIEAGKLTLHVDAFDLREAIETAAQVMRVRADDKGVAFSISYGPTARGLFQGDAVRVRQIVSNLASNAVKFTQAGSVGIEVDVVDGLDGGSTISIAVIDTGIGFDEETGARLFGRFQQADVSITRGFGGTGLGLSICQSLCALMGGSISATSTPGFGSRFEVSLPLERTIPLTDFDRRVTAPTEESDASLIGDDRPLRILLAEDHPTNQRVVALILEPYGVSLTIAADGREAVAAFEAATFDLILMDMQMPEMDGLSATRAIRALERASTRARTPIIMLSANAQADHIEMSMTAGCDSHIAKPITPQGLIEGIELGLAMPQAAPTVATDAA